MVMTYHMQQANVLEHNTLIFKHEDPSYPAFKKNETRIFPFEKT